jgi:hypothetical protein
VTVKRAQSFAYLRTKGRHSCDSPEWFTPAPFADAAREVFGGEIDLDPASHAEANRIIGALRYFDKRANGLRLRWRAGSVFINAPGGLVPEFWHRLIDEWEAGSFKAAIWIGYSIEQLQTLQGYEVRSPLDFPICVPERRIPFVESEAKRLERFAKIDKENRRRRVEGLARLEKKTAAAPSHANYITYIGRAPARFARVFGAFGQVKR